MAKSVEHETLGLGVMSLTPMLGVQVNISQKIILRTARVYNFKEASISRKKREKKNY